MPLGEGKERSRSQLNYRTGSGSDLADSAEANWESMDLDCPSHDTA